MFKTTSKSALLSIITVSMFTLGMPAEVMARGDGGGRSGGGKHSGKIARPAPGGGGIKAANHSGNKGNKAVNHQGGNNIANHSGNKNINHVKGGNKNNNIHVNNNRDVNINVDGHHGGYHGGYHDDYHPIGTAIAVTAAVTATAAIIGSIVTPNQLPSNCIQVNNYGGTYMQCGSTWYQPQYQGNNVTYIVVNQPY